MEPACYPENVVHAVFYRENMYFVFTLIKNIDYIDIRTHTQPTIYCHRIITQLQLKIIIIIIIIIIVIVIIIINRCVNK